MCVAFGCVATSFGHANGPPPYEVEALTNDSPKACGLALREAHELIAETQKQITVLKQSHAAEISELKTQRASGRHPVLMAYATGYKPELIHFFVNSYQRWAQWDAYLVLFTDDGKPPKHLTCPRPDMVEFVAADSVPIPKGAQQVEMKIEQDTLTKEAVVKRYKVYKSWLEARLRDATKPQFSQIFLSDVRDVFFQANPFDRVIGSDTLYVFQEGVAFKNEPHYNQPWVKGCYGDAGVMELIDMDARVVCGGAVAGTSAKVMLTFLDEMLEPLMRGCNDQGALIYIAQVTLPKKLTVVAEPMRRSFVAHALEEWNPGHPDAHPNTGLGPFDIKQDSLGRVLNDLGEPYAILHQADRFSKIWETRAQPIQYLAPNPHRLVYKHDDEHNGTITSISTYLVLTVGGLLIIIITMKMLSRRCQGKVGGGI